MKQTDSQLQLDVMEELKWEPGVDHQRIGVSVTNGVVALSGTVGSYAQKLLAEKTVRRVRGVRAVAEELQVHYASEPKRTDEQIAKRIADILEWDPLVPTGLDITVENGVVKLAGKVEWNYQRDLALEDAAKITGVVRIDNNIQISPPISSTDVSNRIAQAFERNADLEAEKIHVQSDGTRVILTGSVSSWTKRYMAETAAWSAPGVAQVEDKLMIA